MVANFAICHRCRKQFAHFYGTRHCRNLEFAVGTIISGFNNHAATSGRSSLLLLFMLRVIFLGVDDVTCRDCRIFGCVAVSVPHFAAFNAAVDDLCAWRGEWSAAAGEGMTVNRNWSNNIRIKHRGRSRPIVNFCCFWLL